MTKNAEGRQSMLTETQIKERGWTQHLIKKYLGRPDQIGGCNWFRQQFSYLYLQTRVEAVEARSDWKTEMDKILAHRPARQAAARRVVNERIAALDADARAHPNRPGLIPYLDQETVYTALVSRGGFTKDGSPRRVLTNVCVDDVQVTDHVWICDYLDMEPLRGDRVSFTATAAYYPESNYRDGYGIGLNDIMLSVESAMLLREKREQTELWMKRIRESRSLQAPTSANELTSTPSSSNDTSPGRNMT